MCELLDVVERFDDAMMALETAALCSIRYENIPNGGWGYFNFAEGDKRIAMQMDMSETQTEDHPQKSCAPSMLLHSSDSGLTMESKE